VLDAIEEVPAVYIEVAEYRVYCARCCNGRTQIRPGAASSFDRVPCERCRPEAHRLAIKSTASLPG
jgi:hypothetical protein